MFVFLRALHASVKLQMSDQAWNQVQSVVDADWTRRLASGHKPSVTTDGAVSRYIWLRALFSVVFHHSFSAIPSWLNFFRFVAKSFRRR